MRWRFDGRGYLAGLSFLAPVCCEIGAKCRSRWAAPLCALRASVQRALRSSAVETAEECALRSDEF